VESEMKYAGDKVQAKVKKTGKNMIRDERRYVMQGIGVDAEVEGDMKE
jgi:hypothetical protein